MRLTRRRALIGLVGAGALGVAGKARARKPLPERMRQLREELLPEPFESLVPLAKPKRLPRVGDWLAEHPERGQSYARYLTSSPERPSAERRTIDVQPLGGATPAQHQVIMLTIEFIGRFYGLPVRALPPVTLTAVPPEARRVNPYSDDPQLLTTYVLERVLTPARKADAFATIALTTEDLWPGAGWNFVYGQASLHERVGVWSIARSGDPSASADDFTGCLRRTLTTAVHELGHMCSMPHCVADECVMNGSNGGEEHEARPLDLCPICTAKLCWNVGCDPASRLDAMAQFARAHALSDDASVLGAKVAVLRGRETIAPRAP